jgi:hypothetical protein
VVMVSATKYHVMPAATLEPHLKRLSKSCRWTKKGAFIAPFFMPVV